MVSSDIQTLRQRAAGIRLRHQTTFLALAITLLGLGLRLYRIDANGLRNDEAWSLWMAQRGVLDLLWTILVQRVDASPPTYYVLLHPFLLLGQQLLVLRALSILAGTLMVWFTFRLAVRLFDLRVAALSAFFLAVAPLHIEYSQVARAYVLADLWALLSLCFFAQLLFQRNRGWHWVGLVAATAAALYTFYLTFLLLFFENVFIAWLWLRRRLPRSMLRKWLISQVALGILLIPISLSVLSHVGPEGGQGWLARPGLRALIKSTILFSTGDPSYGPIGVTPARIFGLIAILGIAALGVWTFVRRRAHRIDGREATRVEFLAGAVAVPWLAAFAISQVRSVYHEKYLLFLMPPLFILFAWVLTRSRPVILARLAALAFVGVLGAALFVYYTAPVGEQWREAVAYLRAAHQPEDPVVIAPGFYGYPFAYYFTAEFPEEIHALSRTPAIVVEGGEFRGLELRPSAGEAPSRAAGLTSTRRIWFVSGYAPVDPAVVTWIEENFELLDSAEFLGARVRLLQRVQDRP